MAWVSPTGHVPDSGWDNEGLAYNEDTGDFADVFINAEAWSPWFELTHAALNCDKVRFNAKYSADWTNQIDLEAYYDGGWHDVFLGSYPDNTWVEKSLGGTHSVTAIRVKFYNSHDDADIGRLYEVDFWEVEVAAPTVTTQAASSVEATTATGNGNITDNGGENCDERGVEWGTDDGGPYPNSHTDTDSYGEGAFTKGMTGLPTGTTIYYRAKAHNSAGWGYGGQQSFLTKPAAPTSIAATDGAHTDKVVITWVKATGATGYQVYRDGTPLGWLGDVATHDDTGAGAPTITPGVADASDGTSSAHVSLSLSGQLANNGATHTYKVRARNATGESVDSGINTGYRGVGALTYQWQRSAADSDADYSNITGATTASYDDTGAPGNGEGRYYQCVENATGAAEQTSSSDRGYRWMGEKTAHMAAKMMSAGLL